MAAGRHRRGRTLSGGLAFAAKGQRQALGQVTGEMSTAGQRIRLAGGGPEPWSFEVGSSDELRTALAPLATGRRRLGWSVEDVAAFGASAVWTYLSVPFVLLDEGYGLEVLPAAGGCRRLAVRFPPGIATHSARQVLQVDDAGLIRRHDYTALAFGRWAVAAQEVGGHQDFDGLVFPTRRRVTPRLAGRRLPGPTLVWIDLRSVRLG